MDTTEHQIDIKVRTAYVENQSAPEANRFVFAYTITITNIGSVGAQLMSRHWIITDANNKVQEVRGEGVVGEQPSLAPGTSFQYTSGTVLETPVGSMRGSYQLAGEDGIDFEAEIPTFTLAIPRSLH